MKIKIIGSDCSNGMKIIKNIKKLNKDGKYDLSIDLISSVDKDKYQIKNIPALFVDDKMICSGKVLSDRELSRIFNEFITE